MAKNGQVLALSILAAGESAHAMSSFLPSSFTVKNLVLCAGDSKELATNISNLRSGYPLALLFGVGLGAVVSLIAKSPLPVLFAAGTGLAMVMLYEKNLPPDLRLKSPFDVFTLQAPAAPALPMPSGGGQIVDAEWRWVT